MWQQECWTLILLMSDLSPIPILTHQLWQCSGQYRKKLALNYKENNDFWAAIDKQSICRKKPHGGFTSYQSSRGNARIICFHAGKHEIGWGEQPLTSSGLLSGNCTLIVLFLCLAHIPRHFSFSSEILRTHTPSEFTFWVIVCQTRCFRLFVMVVENLLLMMSIVSSAASRITDHSAAVKVGFLFCLDADYFLPFWNNTQIQEYDDWLQVYLYCFSCALIGCCWPETERDVRQNETRRQKSCEREALQQNNCKMFQKPGTVDLWTRLRKNDVCSAVNSMSMRLCSDWNFTRWKHSPWLCMEVIEVSSLGLQPQQRRFYPPHSDFIRG